MNIVQELPVTVRPECAHVVVHDRGRMITAPWCTASTRPCSKVCNTTPTDSRSPSHSPTNLSRTLMICGTLVGKDPRAKKQPACRSSTIRRKSSGLRMIPSRNRLEPTSLYTSRPQNSAAHASLSDFLSCCLTRRWGRMSHTLLRSVNRPRRQGRHVAAFWIACWAGLAYLLHSNHRKAHIRKRESDGSRRRTSVDFSSSRLWCRRFAR